MGESRAQRAGLIAQLASAGLGAGGDAQGDTLSGIENIIGSAFADVLTGDAAVTGHLI